MVADDDPPFGGVAAAVAGAVVDEVGAQAGGLNADAESAEFVVPRGVDVVLNGLSSFDEGNHMPDQTARPQRLAPDRWCKRLSSHS